VEAGGGRSGTGGGRALAGTHSWRRGAARGAGSGGATSGRVGAADGNGVERTGRLSGRGELASTRWDSRE